MNRFTTFRHHLKASYSHNTEYYTTFWIIDECLNVKYHLYINEVSKHIEREWKCWASFSLTKLPHNLLYDSSMQNSWFKVAKPWYVFEHEYVNHPTVIQSGKKIIWSERTSCDRTSKSILEMRQSDFKVNIKGL